MRADANLLPGVTPTALSSLVRYTCQGFKGDQEGCTSGDTDPMSPLSRITISRKNILRFWFQLPEMWILTLAGAAFPNSFATP